MLTRPAFLLLVAPLSAQTVLHHYGQQSYYLGSVVAGAGDLNADGHADFLFGDAYVAPGFLEAHSGSDGSVLYRVFPPSGGYPAVATAVDLDGDGCDDFAAAGAWLAAYSGRSGALLYSVPLAFPVEDMDWVSDLDRDGLPDLALGSYNAVHLHSSATGNPLGFLPGAQGNRVEAFDDADGDGNVDLIVARTAEDPLRVHAIPSGQVLLEVAAEPGYNDPLAVPGDLDRDGRLDILVGEPSAGRARVFSGRNGSLLFEVVPANGFPSSFYAEAVSGAGDVDHDGHPDFAVRSGEDGVYVYSGVDGSCIYHWLDASYYGWRLAHVGDTNGDGFDELIVGNELGGTSPGSGPGYVDVLSPCPLPPRTFCPLTPNSVGRGARIGASGTASIASDDLVLEVTQAVPGQTGLFFYGPLRTQVAFGAGNRCVAEGSLGLFRLGPPRLLDGSGAAQRELDLVSTGDLLQGALLAGSLWHFQFWYRDPAGGASGVNLSDALSVTLCP